MTDSPAPHPDDDLLSRVLDGEVEPAEEARVRADPTLGPRLAALEDQVARLRDVPPLPDLVAGRALAAALAELPGTVVRAPDAAGGASSRRLRPWLGAAAAALVVTAGVVGLVGAGDDRADQDMATAPFAALESAATTAAASAGGAASPTADGRVAQDSGTSAAGENTPQAGAADEEGVDDSARTTSPAPANGVPDDLGEVADVASLPLPPPGLDLRADVAPTSGGACDGAALASASPVAVGLEALTTATLRLDGRPAWAVALLDASSGRLVELVVLSDPGCEVLGRRTP